MVFPGKVVFLPLMFSAAVAVMAQSSTSAPAPAQAQAPANPPAAASAPPVSPAYTELLQPVVQQLHDTVMGLRFEKWKGGNVREEAGRDAGSIITDVNQTLPGLMKDADAAPQRVTAALPLSQNVNALYDVALRVLDAARIAAPASQANQMQAAVNQLAAANKTLYARMADAAARQETHAAELEAHVKTLTAAVAQAQAQPVKTVIDCPAPLAKHSAHRRRKKPVAKSTTTQNGNGQNSNGQKPAAGQQKPQ